MLIDAAKDCGANAVKLQKRANRTLYTREFFDQPYDNEFSFGPTYGEHREALELDRDAYVELQRVLRARSASRSSRRAFDCRERRPPRRARRAGLQARVRRSPQHAVAASRCRVRQADAALDRRRDDGGRRPRGRGGACRSTSSSCILQCTAAYPCETEDLNLERDHDATRAVSGATSSGSRITRTGSRWRSSRTCSARA